MFNHANDLKYCEGGIVIVTTKPVILKPKFSKYVIPSDTINRGTADTVKV